MRIDTKEIELIIEQVLENIKAKPLNIPKSCGGEDGVFENVEEAIEAS